MICIISLSWYHPGPLLSFSSKELFLLCSAIFFLFMILFCKLNNGTLVWVYFNDKLITLTFKAFLNLKITTKISNSTLLFTSINSMNALNFFCPQKWTTTLHGGHMQYYTVIFILLFESNTFEILCNKIKHRIALIFTDKSSFYNKNNRWKFYLTELIL